MDREWDLRVINTRKAIGKEVRALSHDIMCTRHKTRHKHGNGSRKAKYADPLVKKKRKNGCGCVSSVNSVPHTSHFFRFILFDVNCYELTISDSLCSLQILWFPMFSWFVLDHVLPHCVQTVSVASCHSMDWLFYSFGGVFSFISVASAVFGFCIFLL